MIPLVFILIISAILILLVFWVLSTIKDDETGLRQTDSFYFEAGPELYPQGYMPYIAPVIPFEPNRLKLSRSIAAHLLSFWWVDEDKQFPLADENIEKVLFLRIFQSNPGLAFYDVAVTGFKNSHLFAVTAGSVYYTVLGYKRADAFIPILYSNAIMIFPLAKSD